MNRENKYRVWDGSKMEYNVMVGFLGAFYVQGIDEKDSASMSPFNTKYPDPVRLMQYTGLKDKNRKEIYEGDVIEYSSCGLRLKAFIIWNEYCGAWHYQYKGAMGGNPCDYLEKILHNTRFPAEVEIVGNIYEHPHLLSKEEE